MATSLAYALRSRHGQPTQPVVPQQPAPRTYLPSIRQQRDLRAVAPYVPVAAAPRPRPMPRQIRIPNVYAAPPPNLWGDTLINAQQTQRMMQANPQLPLWEMMPRRQLMSPGLVDLYQRQPPTLNALNSYNWGNAIGGWPNQLPPTLTGDKPFGMQNIIPLPEHARV